MEETEENIWKEDGKKNKDREKEAQLGQNIIIFLKLKKK